MTSKRSLAVLITTVLTLAGPIMRSAAADGGGWLGGTWWATVTPPPESGAPAFKLLFTFNDDGNLLATGTAGGDLPGLGNPCHGVWARRGANFAVTYLCFDFDASFQPSGLDKIRGTLSVDSKSQLTGTLAITHYDVNGNEVFSGCCATVTGSRLRVEPLP